MIVADELSNWLSKISTPEPLKYSMNEVITPTALCEINLGQGGS
jgi:hypothetical protein